MEDPSNGSYQKLQHRPCERFFPICIIVLEDFLNPAHIEDGEWVHVNTSELKIIVVGGLLLLIMLATESSCGIVGIAITRDNDRILVIEEVSASALFL
jgi:hypothetical protein